MEPEQRKETERSITKNLIIILLIMVVFFVVILFVIPKINALGVTINNPSNHTYYEKINIPIDYSNDGGSTCYYALSWNGSAGVNKTVNECSNLRIDVDEQGSYVLTVHVVNATASSSASVVFEVDSEVDAGKGIIFSSLMLVLLSVSILFFVLAFKMEDNLRILQVVFIVLGFLTLLSVFHIGTLAIRNYLNFDSLEQTFGIYYNVAIYMFWFVLLGSIVYLIYWVIKSLKFKKYMKEEEE